MNTPLTTAFSIPMNKQPPSPPAPVTDNVLVRMNTQQRQSAGLQRKEARLPDGSQCVYLEGGQGEPLMLLHGFGSNKDHFCRVARALQGRYRLVIPDLVGFGESTRSRELSHAPPQQAARLVALAHHLGIDHLHVGGSSMGGHIAMTWAALYPGMVRSLWLLNPAGVRSAPASEVRLRNQASGRNLLITRNAADYKTLMEMLVDRPVSLPGAMLAALGADRFANADLETQIYGELSDDPLEARIEGLPTATLIVWGQQDRVIHPASAGILRQLLPNAQVRLLDKVGHLPAMEATQRVAEDYLAFRDQLGQ